MSVVILGEEKLRVKLIFILVRKAIIRGTKVNSIDNMV